ncbi:low-density lipoprotein receptor-related protein [Plakobranchus ocellatus]|uniref:Low-density lipoprotein receptor-related protein n=1 Tax=Plakobranchus ocellatus TaxID=259542 RepID=A0AAV4A690_9GAST|nr:low-density lipoprotein receptor-related protein [Plakobranchus ocellatus]
MKPEEPVLISNMPGRKMFICIMMEPHKRHFKCPTGFYISPERACDGWIDCLITHQDEANCSTCLPPSFQCSNGQCVSEAGRCDGFCDCFLCDDEKDCPLNYCEPDSHFLCRVSLKCIHHKRVCDGINDCKNSEKGVDEKFCGASKTPDNVTVCEKTSMTTEIPPFVCPSDGRCLPARVRCDHFPDCFYGEDETNCTFSACAAGEFQCDNQKCIPEDKRCDTVNDCWDWSDEKNCHDVRCPSGQVRCSSGQCILERKWCNHWPNCPDGSDEKNCEYRQCGPDEFTCANGECVPLDWVCYNGRKRPGHGCEDKSHLIDCEESKCREGEFKCQKSMCVDKEQICDGPIDCLTNLNDENGCEYPCPYNAREYTCTCYDREMNCEGLGYPELKLPAKIEHINKLRLSGNFFNNSLTKPDFFSQRGSHMDDIIFLNLANNSLTALNSDTLAGLGSLVQLYLDGNQIRSVENGSFLDLRRLTTL